MISELSERTDKMILKSIPIGPDALYSVADVCSLANISRGSLYLLWGRGEGPVRRKVGGRVMVLGRDYLEWVSSRK